MLCIIVKNESFVRMILLFCYCQLPNAKAIQRSLRQWKPLLELINLCTAGFVITVFGQHWSAFSSLDHAWHPWTSLTIPDPHYSFIHLGLYWLLLNTFPWHTLTTLGLHWCPWTALDSLVRQWPVLIILGQLLSTLFSLDWLNNPGPPMTTLAYLLPILAFFGPSYWSAFIEQEKTVFIDRFVIGCSQHFTVENNRFETLIAFLPMRLLVVR